MKRLLLLPLVIAVHVHADEWQMTGDSELTFEASWEGTALPGRFEFFDVELVTANDSIDGGTLVVTVNLDGADMDDPDINEAIAGDDWFAVSRYPVASYRSDAIRESEKNIFVATGQLELKGHTEAVAIPIAWDVTGTTATLSGELTLDRTRFGIGSGEWAEDESIGKAVHVTFRVVFERR